MVGKIGWIVACLFVVVGCGGSGSGVKSNPCASGGGGCGSVNVNLTAINSGLTTSNSVIHHGLQTKSHASGAKPFATIGADNYRSASILSGSPQEMKIYVKGITVSKSANGGEEIQVYKADETGGHPISLTSGTVDLATALGVSAISLPTDTYASVKLSLARVGQMSGCLSGKFNDTAATTATIQSTDALGQYDSRHVGNQYTNDPFDNVNTLHRFCTQTNRSMLSQAPFSTDVIGSNAQFEVQALPSTYELTDIDLEGGGETAEQANAEEYPLSFNVDFTVAATGTALTLAVDLDRMLRYFANTRIDFNPPNPAMKTGTSYFFTTVFSSSIMVFAGEPGSIEGYQVEIESRTGGCSGEADHGCVVRAWMTLIKDAAGKVISGIAMPDDDNDYTIFKGNIIASSVAAGTVQGTVNIPFELGNDSDRHTGSLDGFTYKTSIDETGTATLTPLEHSQIPAGTTFPVLYTLKFKTQ